MITFINVPDEQVLRENNRLLAEKYAKEDDKREKVYNAGVMNDSELDRDIQLNPDVSKMMLVRSTDGLPRFGFVEPSYRYLEPSYMTVPFGSLFEELGMTRDDARLYYLRARQTVHFSINGPISDHQGGTFKGRSYIILEPLSEHIHDEGLINLKENDTYFNDDIQLSEKAIILMSKEEYEKKKNDQELVEASEYYDIRVFDGDAETAVRKTLQDEGYIYCDVATWGFNTEPSEGSHMLGIHRLFMRTIMETSKSLGITCTDHSTTPIYKSEKKLEDESMNISKRLLGRLLVEEVKMQPNGDELLKKLQMSAKENSNLEEKGDRPEFISLPIGDEEIDVNVKDLHSIVEMDVILEALRKTNESIKSQADRYREKKDKVLKEKTVEKINNLVRKELLKLKSIDSKARVLMSQANDLERTKQEPEEKLEDIETELSILDRPGSLEKYGKKKNFSFLEKYLFKRKEYKRYLKEQEKQSKESEKKAEKIDRLEEEKKKIQEEIDGIDTQVSEIITQLDDMNVQDVKKRLKQLKSADKQGLIEYLLSQYPELGKDPEFIRQTMLIDPSNKRFDRTENKQSSQTQNQEGER